MTRAEALAEIMAMTHDLEANEAGQSRLLERLSVHEAAEELRAALVLAGAEAVLAKRGNEHDEG